MRFPHSHSLDDDPFVALHTINERSPSHHLIPLGSSFDEKMLFSAQRCTHLPPCALGSWTSDEPFQHVKETQGPELGCSSETDLSLSISPS